VAGRPPKPLIEHVHDRTFVARKHEHLLDADTTFDTRALHSLRLTYWMPLWSLVLSYRQEARDDGERRRAALAFEKAVQEDYGRYFEIMGGKLWTQDAEGRWQLKRVDREADYARFRAEYEKGAAALAKRNAPARELVQFVAAMARKWGFWQAGQLEIALIDPPAAKDKLLPDDA